MSSNCQLVKVTFSSLGIFHLACTTDIVSVQGIPGKIINNCYLIHETVQQRIHEYLQHLGPY